MSKCPRGIVLPDGAQAHDSPVVVKLRGKPWIGGERFVDPLGRSERVLEASRKVGVVCETLNQPRHLTSWCGARWQVRDAGERVGDRLGEPLGERRCASRSLDDVLRVELP